jgi:hypothetical protein
VTYAIGNSDKTYLLHFARGQEVGAFLELVKTKHKMSDLCAVYRDGVLLDNGDLFDDWVQKTSVLRVTNSPTEPPEPPAPPVEPAAVAPAGKAVPRPDPGPGLRGSPGPAPAPAPVPPDPAVRFTFEVFTTASYHSLIAGDQLDFEHTLNADAVRDRILRA